MNEAFILSLVFAVLLFTGVPIAYAIGLSALAGLVVSLDPVIASTVVAQRLATGMDSFSLLAIPFFILSGQLMNRGGIARRLIALARILVGRLPGGFAHVNIMLSMLFGSISGSAVAAAAAVGVNESVNEERGLWARVWCGSEHFFGCYRVIDSAE